MLHTELHLRIDDLATRLDSRGNDADFDEAGAHAARGCSVCARALVNAQDRELDVAVGAAVAPPPALRARVLASVMPGLADRGRASTTTPAPGVRIPDPSAAVAHLHLAGAGEEERAAFVDRVAAALPREADFAPALLVEIERFTGFPLLFVSIVRGERVAYRVQRGLGEPLAAFRDMRRETTFCTHCVAAGAPLVVADAASEPFFRASKMVTRYGIHAYVGVPLRAASGVVYGTVCGLDFAPRATVPLTVRLLQLYAEPIAAEIEDAGARLLEPLGSGRFVHRLAWFERLLDLEVEAGADAALLTVDGPRALALAEAADDGEPVGRVGKSGIGLLIRASSLAEAAARAGEIRAGFGGLEVRFAHAKSAASGAALREKALGLR